MSYKILLPLDGSPESESVLPFLRLLHAHTQVEARAIRCYQPLPLAYSISSELISVEAFNAFNEILPSSIANYLETLSNELDGIVVATQAIEGAAAEEIIEKSKEPDIDLVMMTAYGQAGWGRWLLGGVTSKVVRGCHKPVLVIAGEPSTSPKIDSIMVAIDGSEHSLRAFKQAAKLAQALKSELILYQAVAVPWSITDLEPELAKAQASLQELADGAKDISTRVRVYSTDGDPYILERARELKADIIVLGSHGRTGLKRLLMGSIAEEAVHNADRPIMIVH